MNDQPNADDARLRAAATELGLTLIDAQREQLHEFLAQMQRWNRTYNLTALRDPGQMLVQHVFDSLAVVTPLAQELDGIAAPRLLDVGSGGGVPGVVLAIVRPDWQVVCVDAVEKKTAFVRQMAAVLALPNLSAQHARVEALPPQQCAVVISRAFASLADFAALAGRHAADGAPLAAMKGQRPDAEVRALATDANADWRAAEIQTLIVPELAAQRCLVWLRRADGSTLSPNPSPAARAGGAT